VDGDAAGRDDLLGLLLLTLAGTVAHDVVGEIGETVLTIVASLFIVYAHIQNYRQRHHRCLTVKP